ncbi:MAG: zinc-dependent peptidase [Pedobacter sp.]|nr:zinc-dependent peptidase [Pedobacter sp.]
MNLYPIIFLSVVFFGALFLIFRKRKIDPISLTKADLSLFDEHVEFYRNLNPAKKKQFIKKVGVFLASIKIEGVGLEVTALDRVLIAASAIIPIFGFDEWSYQNLGSVVLYPDTFNKDFQFEDSERNIMGMVGNGFMNGQMILSRTALHHGFSKSAGKGNTAIHEFVHLIDDADGAIDGIPEQLLAHEYTFPWLKMMHEEMERIQKNKSDINPYALTNQAEFFAVASEYFFEQPDSLKDKHPELYEQLSMIFGQDLA